ncbi:MAG: metallophosphoesterase family protein [bacterium]
MKVRFLHSSDWQLGVTRHFLTADAQARWSAARFDAICALGRVAAAEGCEFVVVAGDIFESNQVDRGTVARACEALAAIPKPVFLLPGNHDPLDAVSVFRSASWSVKKPAHVHVIEDLGRPVEVRPGVEVAGAPWTSKRPLKDLVAAAASELDPFAGGVRVLVAHGAVDVLSPDRDNPALIRLSDAERAIAESRFHYLALGDRHSFTRVGDSGRICYCGTPEVYDFDEVDPGHVVVAEIGPEGVVTTPHRVGTWRFPKYPADVSSAEDVEALARHLESIPDKGRTAIKLALKGTLTIRQRAHLDETLEHARDVFAAVVQSESGSELAVVPNDSDFDGLTLSGFAASAVQKLRAQAAAPGSEAAVAHDALTLLVRLVGRNA